MHQLIKEFNIPNFRSLFDNFKEIESKINSLETDIRTGFENQNQDVIDLERIKDCFYKLNLKIRLSFSIGEILLDEDILIPKNDNEKKVHLLLYKLSHLWFAYEAFIEMYNLLNSITISKGSKTKWLDQGTNKDYKTLIIENNFKICVEEILKIDKSELMNYTSYLERKADGRLKTRLKKINDILQNNNDEELNKKLTITNLLDITYAIRNNLVHGAESTMYPEGVISLGLKVNLWESLYKLLSIITLSVTNQLFYTELLALSNS